MTNNLTPRPEVRGAIVGVDTHKHIHVAVAIDTGGIHLGDQSFAADSGGYQALLTWAETHGRIQAFGIEGTGGYGVGLARAVRRAGHRVVEVNRADRRLRHVAGKSDRIDAEAAARSVLAGQATATPRTTGRHRLYRGGHRQANAALYRSVIVRMRYHQPTVDYVVRRTADGRTKREIIRCLKRFLAREIYQRVMTDFRARRDVAHAA